MEEIKDLYRVRLYERCNILAVDLTDIIKEIKLFVDEKVIPELKENDCDKFIFSGLELRKEDDKFVWSVYDSNELSDLKPKEITLDDINIEFKGKKEFLKSLEENHNIVTDGYTNFINNRLIVEFINELSKEEMESYITSIGAKLIYVISSYEGIIEINTTFNTISEIENYATQFEEEHADMIGYAVPQTVD